jgi:hypothetical protein
LKNHLSTFFVRLRKYCHRYWYQTILWLKI